MKREVRSALVPCSAAAAFRPIERIGGATGYYYGRWLWRARAIIDRMIGGPGMSPGRRDPEGLELGDEVDCWQVAALDPPKLLRLQARMKMPGRGWLQFEVEERADAVVVHQTVTFEPRGICGHLYWWGLYPVHLFVWSGMLRGIARAAASEPATEALATR